MEKFCYGEMVVKYIAISIIMALFLGGLSTAVAQCSGTQIFTAVVDTFEDGSQPNNNYQINSDCYFLIQPSGNILPGITLTPHRFELENNYDYVHIYDGPTTNDPLIGSYTGINIPLTIYGTNTSMLIHFTSDNLINKDGFEFSYSSVLGPYCYGSQTFTSTSGTIDDGTGTNIKYDNNTDCEWVIDPQNATSVTLNFNYFDTEKDYDYLWVYDGIGTSGNVLGKFSGNQLPQSITNNGPVTLNFTSDYMINDEGWEISWTSTLPAGGGSTVGGSTSNQGYCNSLTTYGMPAMTFHDGSGVNVDYKENSHCFWLIEPVVPADTISIWMVSLFTEYNYDYVKVYDGKTVNDPMIAHWTGTAIWSKVEALSGAALVEFVSDDMINDKGWEIYYQSDYANQVVGIEKMETIGDIKVYPNPTTDNINVMMNNENKEAVVIEILDFIGRQIDRVEISDSEIKEVFNFETMPSGEYIVRVMKGSDQVIKKIMVN